MRAPPESKKYFPHLHCKYNPLEEKPYIRGDGYRKIFGWPLGRKTFKVSSPSGYQLAWEDVKCEVRLKK